MVQRQFCALYLQRFLQNREQRAKFPADMVEHLCNRVVKYGLWRTVHEMRESVFAMGKEKAQ